MHTDTAINYYYWYVWAIYQIRSGHNCSEWQMLWNTKMRKYLNEFKNLVGKEG